MNHSGPSVNVLAPHAPPQHAFYKSLSPGQADAEIRGWLMAARDFPVPRLLGRRCQADCHLVIYEDVFASGRCHLLLGDLIAAADSDPALIPRVRTLMDEICGDLCMAASRTGRAVPLSLCVPALYRDRLRLGGRIDTWYRSRDPSIWLPGAPRPLALRQLAAFDLNVNGISHRLDIDQLIRDLREDLAPDSRWLSAVTQGDPTEPNIAEPRCWLDFEHAGRNALPGEIANLLWYLMAMGGWLVPRYQAGTYARTLRLALPPVTCPQITGIDICERRSRLQVTYSWRVGAGRHAAIERLLSWIAADLGTAAGLCPERAMSQIRSFLAVRLLGVIPLSRLASEDALLLVAKLAESQDTGATLASFTRVSR